MRSVFLNVIIAVAVPLVLVCLLYRISRTTTKTGTGFFRKFPPHVLYTPSVYDLGVNSYYFAGFSAHNIFLGNSTVPYYVVRLSKNFSDSSLLRLDIKADDTLWGGTRLFVDSPTVVLAQANPAALRMFRTMDGPPEKRALMLKHQILDLQPVSGTTVIGRHFDVQKKRTFLFRNAIGSGNIQQLPLLEGSNNIFASDGMLVRHKKGFFSYVYYYRNRFSFVDTSLNTVYTRNTIDTFSTPDISVAHTYNDRALTLSRPPPYVNKTAFATDSLLFIQSAVRATNEREETYKKNIVIDVYSVATGVYRFSFYLDLYKGIKPVDIKVDHDTLYILHGRFLLTYRYNFGSFRG